MYHPEIKPNLGMNKEEYKKINGTTINHFMKNYCCSKILMNTDKKKIASERHDFMLQFLDEFYKEWNVGNWEFFFQKSTKNNIFLLEWIVSIFVLFFLLNSSSYFKFI